AGDPPRGVVVPGARAALTAPQPRAPGEGQTVGPGRVQIVRDVGSELLDPPPLPSAERDGPTYFLTCVRAGRPVEGLCAPDVGRDVQEVLEAALQSSATGREVRLAPWGC